MVSGIPIHIQPVYDYVLSLGISMVDKRLLCVLKGGEASTRLLTFVRQAVPFSPCNRARGEMQERSERECVRSTQRDRALGSDLLST